MRYVCQLAAEGHQEILKKIGVGNKEYQMEAIMKYYSLNTCAARFKPYDYICASGKNGAILHYPKNDVAIPDNCLVLTDMGSKYYGYCSDITMTFPSNGKFNEK